MSITIRTERKGLVSFTELEAGWKSANDGLKEAASRLRGVEFGTRDYWDRWQEWIAAAAVADTAWSLYRERMEVLAAFKVAPDVLGALLTEHPEWSLFEAEDHLYRSPQVSHYEEPVTDEELATIFAGRDDELAAAEYVDRISEEVDGEGIVEIDPRVEDRGATDAEELADACMSVERDQ